MASLKTEPQFTSAFTPPSPAGIFEALNSYRVALALKGAIDLELFTHIARGAKTSQAIATKCITQERGIRILCDFLTINQFLQKSGTEYHLTREAKVFLDKDSPAYLGSIAQFITSPSSIGRYNNLAALVRNGAAPGSTIPVAVEDHEWVEFAVSMAPMMTAIAQIAAQQIAEPGREIKVLDIAAGHGQFGIAIARQNPAARITALDWPAVLQVAAQNAAKAGVADRFQTIAGNAFEVDLGSGYDLVLLPNFLHHFDTPTIVKLLKRLHAVVKPGGRVATIEFVPNDDRVSPPAAASFSIVMLTATEHGDAYTFREFDRMFRSAGFGDSRIAQLEPMPQSLIVTSKNL